MSPETPFFSILMPCYNHAHYIHESIRSLQQQTYPHWEAVLVNDGSTDGSGELLESLALSDSRLRAFHKENGGCGSALNHALRNTSGDWVCWLSSDDLFEPDKLETHVVQIRERPEYHFHHTFFSYWKENEQRKEVPDSAPHRNLPSDIAQVIRFFDWNYVNGISIAVSKHAFNTVGFFDEALKNGQDFDMWIRLASKFKLLYLEKPTVITRWHDQMGTVLFPEAGLYDSGRACLKFLNTHSFEELFPFIDFQSQEQALCAFQQAMKGFLNFGNYLCYGFGSLPALSDRMLEWLTAPGNEGVRKVVEPSLREMVEELDVAGIDRRVTGAFREALDGESPYAYPGYDPQEEFEQHLLLLERTGKEDAPKLARYLYGSRKDERVSSMAVLS